jgi:FkbM family methyltransferase
MTLPPKIRRPLVRARRRLWEALGSARYSHPALNDIDKKLARHLTWAGGFYIEAGANDGYAQSNTYYFERWRGWRGILVEPIPELAAECRRNRPGATVVQAALVGPGFAEAEIEMQAAGLMSMTEGAFDDPARRERHLGYARRQRDVSRVSPVRVPVRTLSTIIAAEGGGREVDILSLDVEGAELAALAGLDLARHSPRFICIEARSPEAVAARLGDAYELVEVLSANADYQDLLFRRR